MIKYILFLQIICFYFYSHAEVNYTDSAFDALKKEKWDIAVDAAEKSNKSELLKIILSEKYSNPSSKSSFEEIVKFLHKNPKWPGYREMLINAECNINKDTDFKLLKKWFDKYPSITANGHKYRAYAEIEEYKSSKTSEEKALVRKIIQNAWINGEFGDLESNEFLKKYKKILSPEDHARKVNLLLWEGDIKKAKSLLYLVKPKLRNIFNSRINSMEDVKDAVVIHKNLDDISEYYSGALYSYINYQIKHKPDLDITPFIMNAPSDVEHSAKWWKLKSKVIRKLLKEKSYKKAYMISSKHYSMKSEDKGESHWISGFIALSFLNSPKVASRHFEKFYHNAKDPALIAKSAYWMAKALGAKNKRGEAYHWVAKAAAFPETFYGQLANEYVQNKNLHLNIRDPKNIYKEKFDEDEIVKSIHLLREYKQYRLAQNYMKSAINNSEHMSNILFMNVMKKEEGGMLVNHENPGFYNIPKNRIETSLVYAVIKQESAFNPKAVSYADARGLMQIRPIAARDAAESLKVPYSKSKLTSDVSYNINLGTKFLQTLLKKFDGSYVLALSAYNAGAKNVEGWINRNGDPREMKSVHDILIWIEMIPFEQTRKYVPKILENLQIYRHLLKDEGAFKIKNDLIKMSLNASIDQIARSATS